MEAFTTIPDHSGVNHVESDYGSDFSVEEELIVAQLLENVKKRKQGLVADPVLRADINTTVVADLLATTPAIKDDDVEAKVAAGVDRRSFGNARTRAVGRRKPWGNVLEEALRPRSSPLDGITYPDLSNALLEVAPDAKAKLDSASVPAMTPATKAPAASSKEDSRTPIQRFRSFPKKPLTVTDLSSGAWCEMQYWYTLTRLPGGRKTRTAAMKGGTKVHQTLEDQVHTTIRVTITAKEEAFALRLWNVIQGLRTLRETGLTRELEVWGIVKGQVVNGVIDELSHTNPSVFFEQEAGQEQAALDDTPSSSQKQSSITTYFDPHRRLVYLTDVKTRGAKTLPSGAALRPSKVQLFLYHRLLAEMAAGKLDFATIVARYGLNAEARFSDSFIAQIGSLHDEVFHDAESEDEDMSSSHNSPIGANGENNPDLASHAPSPMSPMSPLQDLIRYRSIKQILPLLEEELRLTFPQGAGALGEVVAIQYRHREDGHIIGNQLFPVDKDMLERYLNSNLAWWLGNREAEGVPIEEAYKCRTCEFADNCQWRTDREEEFLRRPGRRSVSRGPGS